VSIFTKRTATVYPGLEPLQPWQDAFLDPLVDPLLILNLRLHVLDRVAGLHIQRDRLARERLDEDLHIGYRTIRVAALGHCRAHRRCGKLTQNQIVRTHVFRRAQMRPATAYIVLL
jgi:hypothetical protein